MKQQWSVEGNSTIILAPQERGGGSCCSSHAYGRDEEFACRSNLGSNSEFSEWQPVF